MSTWQTLQLLWYQHFTWSRGTQGTLSQVWKDKASILLIPMGRHGRGQSPHIICWKVGFSSFCVQCFHYICTTLPSCPYLTICLALHVIQKNRWMVFNWMEKATSRKKYKPFKENTKQLPNKGKMKLSQVIKVFYQLQLYINFKYSLKCSAHSRSLQNVVGNWVVPGLLCKILQLQVAFLLPQHKWRTIISTNSSLDRKREIHLVSEAKPE